MVAVRTATPNDWAFAVGDIWPRAEPAIQLIGRTSAATRIAHRKLSVFIVFLLRALGDPGVSVSGGTADCHPSRCRCSPRVSRAAPDTATCTRPATPRGLTARC